MPIFNQLLKLRYHNRPLLHRLNSAHHYHDLAGPLHLLLGIHDHHTHTGTHIEPDMTNPLHAGNDLHAVHQIVQQPFYDKLLPGLLAVLHDLLLSRYSSGI